MELDHCYTVAALKKASVFFFFFNDTATTEIYTLSLHDALPISRILLVSCSFVSQQNLGALHVPHRDCQVQRCTTSRIEFLDFMLQESHRNIPLITRKMSTKNRQE